MKTPIIALLIMLTTFLASCGSTRDNAGDADRGSPPTEQPINNPPSSPGTPPTATPPEDTELAVSLSSSVSEGEVPLKVVFTASANEQVSYKWYVDDRQIEVAGDTLTYTFENAGSFAATVSGTNTDGDVANASTTITSTPSETEPTPPSNPGDPTPPTDPVNPTPPTDPAPPETPAPPTDPVDPAPPETPTPPENPAPPEEPAPPEQPAPPENPAPPETPTPPAPPENPAPPEDPAPPDVEPPPPGNPADFALEYRVESSCGVAFVTYHTMQQGVEQGIFGNGTVYLSNDAFKGASVFVQGTNYCDSGKITVQVRKYGEVYRTATSSGKGTVATLSLTY